MILKETFKRLVNMRGIRNKYNSSKTVYFKKVLLKEQAVDSKSTDDRASGFLTFCFTFNISCEDRCHIIVGFI